MKTINTFQNVTLLTIILLCLGSSQAQNWFGLRTGYPLGVTLHYGVDNGFSPGVDLRVSANVRVRGSSVDFGIGADAMRTIVIEQPFELYVGGGPSLDFGGGGALIDVHGLLGGEFRFTDVGLRPLGIFAEVALGAAIGIGRPSLIPSFGGAVGFNWHF